MNIDNLTKKRLLVFWLVFLGIILSIYLSTEIIVPSEFKKLTLNDSAEAVEFNITSTNQVILKLSNLSPINQFLLPILKPVFKDTSFERITIDMEYEVLDLTKKTLFSEIYTYLGSNNKGLFAKKKSHHVYLPYIFNLREEGFYFFLKIVNTQQVEKYAETFQIEVETNNERFFYFFLGLKTCLFVLSLFSCYNFARKYSLQIKQTRETEQKLILTASFLLVAYNLPFNFYLSMIEPSLTLLLLSSLCNILFYSFICYIWMVTFEVISSDHLEPQRHSQELRSTLEESSHFGDGAGGVCHLFMGSILFRE